MRKVPLHHCSEFVPLSSADLHSIERLSTDRLHLKRHDVIRGQGDPVRDIYLLTEGWVGSCMDVATGTRQVVKAHLPGEMLGAPSMTLTSAAETLMALTRATVEVVPVSAVARLFLSSPQIAAAMFLSSLKERVFLMDRLTSVARTSAVQRLSAFLVSIYERLKLVGLEEKQFELPLSQNELADVIGITAVHANRTWAQLERTGLIQRRGKRITLLNLEGLKCLGAVPQRRFGRLPHWTMAIDQEASQSSGTMVG
jgi:CRP/FNR family transcriptional regulator, anaerobic regulatory protein